MERRTAILAAALFAAALSGAAGARAQIVSADLDVLVAEKFLDAADWGPTDRQGELGLLSSWQRRAWPVQIAVDFLAASREVPVSNAVYSEQQARTFELDLGARRVWTVKSGLRVYLGGGPALAFADLEELGPVSSITSSDGGVGGWVDGGAYWAFAQAFNVGFDARFSSAGVRLFDQGRDAGGLHFGLFAGYHFGS